MLETECLSNNLRIFEKDDRFLVVNPLGFKWAVTSESGLSALRKFTDSNTLSDSESKILTQFKRDGIIETSPPDSSYQKRSMTSAT